MIYISFLANALITLQAPPVVEQGRPNLTPAIVKNEGQFADAAQFSLQSKDQSIFFHGFGLSAKQQDGKVFDLHFPGAQKEFFWRGLVPSQTAFHYCTGAAKDWVLDASGWQSISAPYQDGIDLRVDASEQKLKYSFHLDAGVTPENLVIDFTGVDSVEIQSDGGLIVTKGGAQFTDASPTAWQIGANGQQPVEVQFKKSRAATAVELVVGSFDPNLALIVDPEVILFCGFIGGSLQEEGRGIGVDAAGNIFLTGFAESRDMPVVNAWQSHFGGGFKDVWVAKITPDGVLEFLTYLGGRGSDLPYDLSMDSSGNAYVVGGTASTNFPYLNGPDSVHHGGLDCFVAKLNTQGIPVYSGTFGGTEFDSLRGNYVDASGNHLVIGRSLSGDGSFPVVNGPSLTHSGGVCDVIVAKISADGSTLMFSGFIGGNQFDYGRDIVSDSNGYVYACGWTNSDENSFPVHVGPSLTYGGGEKDYGLGWKQYGDAWVAKFSPSGVSYDYIGYIGGARADAAFGIALDDSNRAIVAGHTSSDENTFPVVVGPSLKYSGNNNEDVNPYGDMWVGRVNSTGTGLEFCGYVGGSKADRAWRMARSANDGAIYLVGNTASTPETIPSIDAGPRSVYGGDGDGLLVRVEPDGRWVDYATYFPGEGKEVIRDVVIGIDNKVHLIGWTESPLEFPVVESNWSFGGVTDAFVATLPPFHQLIRGGNLWPDPMTGLRPAILTVNGSAGADYRHEVSVASGSLLTISIASPANRNEAFALYLVPREAAAGDVFRVDYAGKSHGTSVFALPPLLSSDPSLVTVVNGFGLAQFGSPLIAGIITAPAFIDIPAPGPGTYTLQAVISDHRKLTYHSLSNAVVVRVN
ncbi:MAG: SBBP repeat-containing protein [Planctomycetes bacterium]|nr:SBBP repeat-containing protein [Planctomycetota bacterium]